MNNKQRYKVIKKQPTTISLFEDLIRGKIDIKHFPKRYKKYYIRTIFTPFIPIPRKLEDEIKVYVSDKFTAIEKVYLRETKSVDREN